MPEYVVDAAAAVSALGRKDAVGIAAHKLIAEATCHAPHLLDAEVGHVLRCGERAGEISEQTARPALHALPEMIDYRYPHAGRLAALAWKLATYDHLLRRALRRTGRSIGDAAADRRRQTQQSSRPVLPNDLDQLTASAE